MTTPTQFDELFKSDTCPTCGGDVVHKANGNIKEAILRGNKDSNKHAKPGSFVESKRTGKKKGKGGTGLDGQQGKKTKIVGKSMDEESSGDEVSTDDVRPADDMNKALFPVSPRFYAVQYERPEADEALAKSIESGDESERSIPPARNLRMEQELALRASR